MEAQQLLDQLKEQHQKNAEAAEWALRYPDAGADEKLKWAKVQDETYNAVQAIFERFIAALASLPEAERAAMAKEAMGVKVKPISPFMKKRLVD